jgi:hypothetical protein
MGFGMSSDDVRRVAARVQGIGDDVRRLAQEALAAGGVRWQSVAADGFRCRLAQERARLRATVAALDGAAEALTRHAVALDQVDEPHRPRWVR